MESWKSDSPATSSGSVWTWAALVVAAVGVAGSLALTLVEQKQACALCFYQRTFALAVVAVLGQGLLTGGVRAGRLALLALPLALGGLGVAAFHVSLENRGILECPAGLLGLVTAPAQSLGMFVLLTLLLTASLVSGWQTGEVGGAGVALAILLGVGLAGASLSANPKLPTAPAKPYEAPPMICRPPFLAGSTP